MPIAGPELSKCRMMLVSVPPAPCPCPGAGAVVGVGGLLLLAKLTFTGTNMFVPLPLSLEHALREDGRAGVTTVSAAGAEASGCPGVQARQHPHAWRPTGGASEWRLLFLVFVKLQTRTHARAMQSIWGVTTRIAF